jgi:hypothetical protein
MLELQKEITKSMSTKETLIHLEERIERLEGIILMLAQYVSVDPEYIEFIKRRLNLEE